MKSFGFNFARPLLPAFGTFRCFFRLVLRILNHLNANMRVCFEEYKPPYSPSPRATTEEFCLSLESIQFPMTIQINFIKLYCHNSSLRTMSFYSFPCQL